MILCSYPLNPQNYVVDNIVDNLFHVDKVDKILSYQQPPKVMHSLFISYNQYFI